MIPLLYDEMGNLYTAGIPKEDYVKANIPSHRIGYLVDTISCKVTEERNGLYELVLTYPVTGALFGEITPGRAIMAKAHPNGDDQLFRIYRISKAIRGIMTVYARHISYDLSGYAYDMSGQAPSPATPEGWMYKWFNPYTFFSGHSDITSESTKLPIGVYSIRSLLGGVDGSLLDLFHGEYEFDNYVVNYYSSRGTDKGVVVEYGKNLTEMTMEQEYANVYTHISPYATYYKQDGSQGVVTAPQISTGIILGYSWDKILDVTNILALDEGVVPTQSQVTDAATAWLAQNPMGAPPPTIKVSFEDIVDASVPNPGIDLCDTVTVRYLKLGVSVQQKVVATEYDTLLERYSRITLGTQPSNLAGDVSDLQKEVALIKQDKPRFTAGAKTVDLTSGEVALYDGTYTKTITASGPTINGGNSSTAASVATATITELASFSVTPGVYMITATARFASNSSGYREICLRSGSTSSMSTNLSRELQCYAAPANGTQTCMSVAAVQDFSSNTTVHLYAYQNSGSTLSTGWAYHYTRLA